jgi:hypothetical protein
MPQAASQRECYQHNGGWLHGLLSWCTLLLLAFMPPGLRHSGFSQLATGVAASAVWAE